MVQSSLHITTRMNNSIPRAIPFLGCLLARLPACSPFFLPGFQLNSQSKAETTTSIYQPRKHTQSPPHSPSNPKIPQHEAQPLFVFSTTNQTHPPTHRIQHQNQTQSKPKHKHTHTHTQRNPSSQNTYSYFPFYPRPALTPQQKGNEYAPRRSNLILHSSLNNNQSPFLPFLSFPFRFLFSSLLSSSLSPHLLLLCLLPSSPTKNQKKMKKKNSNKKHSRQQHDAARQSLIAKNPSPKQTSSSCSASSTHPARFRGLKQEMG